MESNKKSIAIRWPVPYLRIHSLLNSRTLLKFFVILFWLVVLLLAILELKRHYDIDMLPGYNSPVDDAYGAARGSLANLLKKK